MILHYIYTMCDVHHVQYLYMYENHSTQGSHIDIQLLFKKNIYYLALKVPFLQPVKTYMYM